MTYRGKIRNGVVVLEDPKALPEGTLVRVEPVEESAPSKDRDLDDLWDSLLRLAGSAKGLPRDMARNHDHYLHGGPKR